MLNNAQGEAVLVKKAICMHEEDAGIASKHTDYRTRHTETRRMRKLVVSFISTIANYDYGYYVSFFQVRCVFQAESGFRQNQRYPRA